MNARQMVEHLAGGLLMSIGKIPVKIYTPEEMLFNIQSRHKREE